MLAPTWTVVVRQACLLYGPVSGPDWTGPRGHGRSSPAVWRSPPGLAPLIERIDGELHPRAQAGPGIKVLRTLPGAGEFTALMMLTEIGVSRFPSARKLAGWAGLTPAVRGSDLTVRHGHITRARLGPAAAGAQPGRAGR
jgi:Transposase IS116/IS110/IS902 family